MIREIIVLALALASAKGNLKCGKNESWKIGFCEEKCATLGSKCNVLIPSFGCRCDAGHARNAKNVCVLRSSCCTGQNEKYSLIGYERTCVDPEGTKSEKKEGCFCKDGFLRNDKRQCVKKSKCQIICNGSNEEYQVKGCDKNCDGENCGRCPGGPGCYCKVGSVRNKLYKCIDIDKCEPKEVGCTKPNEIFKETGCDTHCDPEKPKNCPGPPGCYCTEGKVRCEAGNCIDPRACYPTTPICTSRNEVYQHTGCDLYCDGEPATDCPGLSGCYCAKGTVRNSTFDCVNISECRPKPPACTNPNEEYKQTGCDKNCDPGRPQVCTGLPGCYCANGTLRNRANKCVEANACEPRPPKCTKPNETYKEKGCDKNCDPEKPQKCSELPGCYCTDGSLRNNANNCVNANACEPRPPKCTKANETYKEKGCDKNCDPEKPQKCSELPGCYCADGTLRNNANNCVNANACEPRPPKCTKANETYKEKGCDKNCDPEKPQKCSELPGCYCADGTLRNNANNCVNANACEPRPPKCTKPNETYKEKGCDKNCDPEKPQKCSELPGCYCTDGTLRNNANNCVNANACEPRPPKCTKPNEAYKEKGCDKNCDPEKPQKCSELPGCYCTDGTLRNNANNCVNANACEPRPPKCTKPNETYKEKGCDKNCDPEKPQKCSELPGCYCADGTLRNNANNCVNANACEPRPPKCTKPNETYREKGCDKNCDPEKPQKCSELPGCYCADGTLRNNANNCVNANACEPRPPKCTKPNETYKEKGCDKNCDPEKPQKCSELPGCYCADGTLRNNANNCVNANVCEPRPPKCTKPNETYKEKGCDKNCDPEKPQKCSELPGCYCTDGTLRNNANNCVNANACEPRPPKCTKPNETYKEKGCDKNCDPEKPQKCSELPGCYCADGTLRNNANNCVNANVCEPRPPKCTKPNETYKEKGCDKNCDPEKPQKCSELPGCYCTDGSLRNNANYCVNANACEPRPPKCTKPNETYKEKGCDKNCDPEKPQKCSELPGCYCADGTLRNNANNCVNANACEPRPPKCTKANETYKEKGCDKNCDPEKPQKCSELPGCYCTDGTLRNNANNCVNANACEPRPPKCTKPNETYKEKGCDKNCDPGKPQKCSELPGCYCTDETLRNNANNCVNANACEPRPPKCTKPNETYKEKGCDKNCDPEKPQKCSELPGCYCTDGTLRNNANNCVNAYACEPRPPKCTKDNETYKERGCDKNCDPEKPQKCSELPGCYCADGTLRNNANNCVNANACEPRPPKCTKANETYKEKGCDKNCDPEKPQKCSELPGCYCTDGTLRNNANNCVNANACEPRPPKCTKPNETYKEKGCDKNCDPEKPQKCSELPGCYCADGALRNNANNCVNANACEPRPPKCTKPNETYKEKGCDKNCDPEKPQKCSELPGCYCADGALRNNANNCVNANACEPRPPKCTKDNETYKEKGCDKNCDPEKPQKCSELPGCYCTDGTLRNNANNCVNANACEPRPPKCTKPNETYKEKGCDKNCDPEKPQKCSELPGCYCADGTLRNNANNCVNANACEPRPPKCTKPNETYKEKGCDKNCDPEKPQKCSELPGCYCTDGTLRNNANNCVNANACEPRPPKCTKPNETYKEKGCDKNCDPEKPQKCSELPGCYCADGTQRNNANNCVNANACEPRPPKCTKPNEAYKEKGCDKNCDPEKPQKCSELPGCYCTDGTLRNNANNCVNANACEPRPPKCTKPNETYKEKGCDKNCDPEKPQKCSELPGCYCADGTLRNNANNCVNANACEPRPPKCTKANETYKEKGCDKNCDPEKPQKCSELPGCYCTDGTLRNNANNCVNANACEPRPPKCTKPNETYKEKGCDKNCDPEKPQKCSELPGCYCVDGTLRNNANNCVNDNACEPRPPKCTKPNETYKEKGCDKNCDPDKPQKCSELPGCYCADGTLRNNANNCVNANACELRPPKCTKPNETYKEKGCDKNCDPEKPQKCSELPGCYCADGTLRNNANNCVNANACEPRPPKCTKPNETYKEKGCDKNCDPDKQQKCSELPGCYCTDGTLRNNANNCVNANACEPRPPKCTKPNETYKEKGCDKNCDPEKIQKCSELPGCYCADGTLRNNANNCVNANACEPRPPKCTKPNETYKEKGCDKNCDPEKPQKCSELPGCYCADGTLRNNANNCVSTNACEPRPPKCTKPNETYREKGCDKNCDPEKPQKCSELPGCYCTDGTLRNNANNCVNANACEPRPPKCTKPNETYREKGCDKNCDPEKPQKCSELPGCYCTDGTLRNNANNCVNANACEPRPPKCTKPNETYREKGCDKNCDPEKTQKCSELPGCYCTDGTLRNNANTCVNANACEPRPPKCTKPNETYKEKGCDKNCDPEKPQKCSELPGCYCTDGTLRNNANNCVNANACEPRPPKCTKPNETYKEKGCDKNCDPEKPQKCSSLPGCYCTDGTLRNNANNCVDVNACEPRPPKCTKPNETYKEKGCDKNCDPEKPQRCSELPGCYCTDGTLRNNANNCVNANTCEPRPPKCTKPNETYKEKGCDKNCDPEKPQKCSELPGCYCTDGTLRNNANNCVNANACEPRPPKCTKPNETYKEKGCDKNCDPENPPKCSQLPGCYCTDGALRNGANKCVEVTSCEPIPPKCTRPNESYKDRGCDKNCDPEKPQQCSELPGCYCTDGTLRNYTDDCVDVNECELRPPTCTRPNETYKEKGCDKNCDEDKPQCSELPGCYCVSGTVRNNDNACVDLNDCEPTPPICTEPNEIYKEKGCDKYCDQEQQQQCSELPGCYCTPGTLRNSENTCVAANSCEPTPPKCTRPNEIYKNGGCDKTCDPEKPQQCSKLSGCYCTDGTLRNNANNCVNEEDCELTPPRCTRLNEVYKEKGCDKNCDPEKPQRCSELPGCYCTTGTLRNNANDCVDANACEPRPPKCARPNETFKLKGCDKNCDPDKPQRCSELPGCYCDNETLRNTANICVDANSCEVKPPKCTRPNEIFKEKGCDKNCDPYKPQQCSELPGCYCVSGTLRNTTNDCVDQNSCEPSLPECRRPNEIFKERGCDDSCDSEATQQCSDLPGCYCSNGTLRNSSGDCVDANFCEPIPPKCTRPNETYKEKGCDRYCDQDEPQQCSELPGCFCTTGTLRNNDNACVDVNACEPTPPKCTGPNEVYKDKGCDKNCDPEKSEKCPELPGCYCSVATLRNNANICVDANACEPRPPKCTRPNETYKLGGCDENCDPDKPQVCSRAPGCYCTDGTRRNNANNCVDVSACEPKPPKCTKPNETYKLGGCDQNCDPDKPQVCSRTPGCYCTDGKRRNNANNCVDVSACEPKPPKCTKPNETYKLGGCDQNCDPDKPQVCSRLPGCYCNEGTRRNRANNCVDISACEPKPPKCTKPNETYKLGGCDENCDPDKPQVCSRTPGCYCTDGTRRNNANNCVDVSDCDPKPPKCTKPNETYKLSGCDENCDPDKPQVCSRTPGCYCTDGTRRNNANNCVDVSACEPKPPKCTKPNETYKLGGCDENCDPDKPQVCSRTPGCYCTDGTRRNNANNCVDVSDCDPKPPKCTKPNETYKLSGCDENCDPDKPQVCSRTPGCYCTDGTRRNNANNCVDVSACEPKPPKCTKPNETYKLGGCDENCDPDKPQVCSRTPGCYCTDGTRRNNANNCVDVSDCEPKPPKCTKPNETYKLGGCDENCDPDKPQVCSRTPGCYCTDGTRRNNANNCVDVSACEPKPPKCTKPNETYKLGGCDENCDPDKPQVCSRTPGCYCTDGKRRNNANNCVDVSACEPKPPKCTKPNEAYKLGGCDENCDPDKPQVCSRTPGCYCTNGTRRNNANNCVDVSACEPKPPKCTKPNETYKLGGCDENCDPDKPQVCSRTPGCYCTDGKRRNNANNCVDVSACEPKPPKCTKPNETYKLGGCDENCDPDKPQVCSRTPGCYCTDGTRRNNANNCVDVSACEPKPPKCTKPNETYKLGGCDENCDPDKPQVCSRTPGCYCDEGSRRNSANSCVDVSACEPKPPKCTKPNETYKLGGCDENCDPDKPQVCSKLPGCYCDEGSRRNSANSCVDVSACEPKPPKCTKPNESYKLSGCDENCDPDKPPVCSRTPGCYCTDGTRRNNANNCVDVSACEPKPPKCTKPKETYKERGCDENCDPDKPQACSTLPGCYCVAGARRNNASDCVDVSACEPKPPKCTKPNETYKLGGCDENCDPDKPQVCSRVPGCYCAEGARRNSANNCVDVSACDPKPPKCTKANEVYQTNGCDTNCDGEKPKECPGGPGCYCDKGRVRDQSGSCIDVVDCEKKVPKCLKSNEVYKTAGCDLKCDGTRAGKCPGAPGCYCEQGKVRNSKNACVEDSSCAPDLPKCLRNNELFKMQGCDLNCDGTPHGPCPGRPGCYCFDDLLRNDDNECVEPCECY